MPSVPDLYASPSVQMNTSFFLLYIFILHLITPTEEDTYINVIVKVLFYVSRRKSYTDSGYIRRARQDSGEDLQFSDSTDSHRTARQSDDKSGSSGSASEQVPVKLAFPGNDFERVGRAAPTTGQ